MHKSHRFGCRIAIFWLLTVSLGSSQAASPTPDQNFASPKISADRLKQYSDLALQWEQEYLRIDTTNPPGNETRSAAFFKKIFDAEGIENRVFEYVPGRADIWARVPHNTTETKRPIILLNHMDVVTSDASLWNVTPFSAAIVADSIYGRGAPDIKSEVLVQVGDIVMLKCVKA